LASSAAGAGSAIVASPAWTLELVQHKLALRLRVALGIELCHRIEERVELKRASASRSFGFSGASGICDVRAETADALVRGGDFMTIGFARGARIGRDRAAEGAETQERREVAALCDPSGQIAAEEGHARRERLPAQAEAPRGKQSAYERTAEKQRARVVARASGTLRRQWIGARLA
jgi:hypothetical protein